MMTNLPRGFFISYQPGRSKDVSLNTGSSWIKHAIRAAYEAAESVTSLLQLHGVKAHDVRVMSASLAFGRFGRHRGSCKLVVTHNFYFALSQGPVGPI